MDAPAITVNELKQRRDAQLDFILLDVREPHEIEICRIEGSVNIPLQSVTTRSEELLADKQIVVMCHHGGRSARATAWLREHGFDAVNLEGGIDEWAMCIEPDMARY
jgi:rhodanese-related sulfurtransferase